MVNETIKSFVDEKIKLSIIIPVYNEQNYLSTALDSILMQEVNFSYEVILVDDCSTDKTPDIISKYCAEHSHFKKITHEKNKGNAIAFYNGLNESLGKYMAVLDADDFYSVTNKLQKQVDFLDHDYNNDYVATCHHDIRLYNDYTMDFLGRTDISDFNYISFLKKGHQPYFHTSSYMFRNIFSKHIPDVFKYVRGDNIRVLSHLKYSGKSVKVLNFVGSVYRYSERGIWSGICENEKRKVELSIWENAKKFLANSDIENEVYNEIINRIGSHKIGEYRAVGAYSIEEIIDISSKKSARRAFDEAFRDFYFNSIYVDQYYDSLIESIGRLILNSHLKSPVAKRVFNEELVLITISHLDDRGGGVFYEIMELVKMHISAGHKIQILISDQLESEMSSSVKEKFVELEGCSFWFTKGQDLKNVILEVYKQSFGRIYHYCGHKNSFNVALIQTGVSKKNIFPFSFDHGFVVGLLNSSIDVIISKRSLDYRMLVRTPEISDKVIFIPCLEEKKKKEFQYSPLKNGVITTATSAARFYKLNSAIHDYGEMVASLIKKTGGVHYHFGNIDNCHLEKIKKCFIESNIDFSKFINIKWSDNLSKSFHENGVDIFIEPFSVVSYKISIEMMSAGIPIIKYRGSTRMQEADFLYKDCLIWSTKDDFVNQISSLKEEDLVRHSRISRKYYEDIYDLKVLHPCYLECKEFDFSHEQYCGFIDSYLLQIPNNELQKSELQKTKILLYGVAIFASQVPILSKLISKKRLMRILRKLELIIRKIQL